jgi:hypothetical protein
VLQPVAMDDKQTIHICRQGSKLALIHTRSKPSQKHFFNKKTIEEKTKKTNNKPSLISQNKETTMENRLLTTIRSEIEQLVNEIIPFD